MSWYYAENNDRRGPIEDAAFQELVRGGTIKPETLVWREGMANWIPFSQTGGTATAPAAASVEGGVRCAQCGGTFPASDVITIAGRAICATCKPRAVQEMIEGSDTAGTTIDPEKLLAEVRARGGYQIKVGDVLSRAWALVKANLWPCIGTTALVYFVMMIAQQCLSIIGSCLITGPAMGGLFAYFLKQLRGQKAVVGDGFVGFNKPHFGRLAAAGTVQILITSILAAIFLVPAFMMYFPMLKQAGENPPSPPPLFVVLCFLALIPMLYFTLSWILSYAFVIDKGLRFWPAMELSRKLVGMNFGGWVLLTFVTALLSFAGVLALCVGVFFVLPIAFCSIAIIYEDILTGRNARTS